MKDWKIVKLGTLLTESKIESTNPDTKKRIRVKLNVGGVEQRPNTNDKEGATKYYIRNAGQFIYGKQNLHKGAFGIVPNELDGYESSSDIPAFDVDESCYPEWIFFFFKQGNFYLRLESIAQGVGSKRIHPKQIFELSIPIPPLDEQKVILDSIFVFEQKRLKLIKEIDYQVLLSNQLKKVIAQEAFQGILTEEWRQNNPNVESAIELVKRIQPKDSKDLKRKRTNHRKPIEVKLTETPFKLPSNWRWARFQEIATIASNLVHPSDFLELPHIAPDNIEKDTGKLLKYRTVKEDHLISSKHLFYPGQILYSKIRPHLNKLVEINFKGLCSADMYPIDSLIDRSYLFYYMLSTIFVSQSVKTESRVAMPKINQNELNKILVPVAPLEEQQIISKRLSILMNFSDSIRLQAIKSKEDIDLLAQSALSEVYGNQNMNLQISKKEIFINKTNLYKKNADDIINIQENKSLMELLEILKNNGKTSAVTLWKMSKFENDIDAFYEELKRLIEVEKTIQESKEKGFLELVK